MRSSTALLLVALNSAAASAWADGPSSFPTNEDLRHTQSLADPRLAPDGRQVLIRITDSTADGAKSHLWLVDVGTNKSRQITYSPEADKTGERSGEWMPDGGSILFVAHRGEHTQLFRLPTNGGEAKPYDLKIAPPADASKLPDAVPPVPSADAKQDQTKSEPLAIDVGSFEIAPDGKTIAFIANDPKTPGEKKQSDAKADAVWVDHEIHGARLYLLDPDSNKVVATGLTPDVKQVAWSHDGAELIVITDDPNGASDLRPSSSAWRLKVSDPEHPEKISALPATIQSAIWSPDANSIAFLAQAQADTPPGYRDLFEYNLQTRATRNISERFSGSVGFQRPFFLPGGSILMPAEQGFQTTLVRIDPGVSQIQPVALQTPFPTPVIGSLNSNLKQTGWVFLGSSSTQPFALFYTADLSQPARRLDTPAIEPPGKLAVSSKRISWASDKLTIEGLLYLPPQAASHKVPLIVEVHGGPLGAFVDDYQPFIQFLVGQGWAVLRTNPRGSSNYGPSFAAANKNDLGGGDYRDIMAGVDYVLKTEPIDASRLALEGYSYGGEMAGFVEGKTSRFKAIVSGAPVIDQYSEYGTEGDSYYDRWYFGKPWEHPQDAWRQSPIAGVAHAKTPFLLLQGDADSTDPLGQSQEMYRALRQMGVPVDLVTYPRDNHGPLARAIYGSPVPEPWHGFDARQRIVKFLNQAFANAPATGGVK